MSELFCHFLITKERRGLFPLLFFFHIFDFPCLFQYLEICSLEVGAVGGSVYMYTHQKKSGRICTKTY